jgi:predicted DsbA family dithiol-disulfide isomerase
MGIVEELKKEYDIKDEWAGFEIHPETPKEGVDIRDMFGEARLEGMFENLKSMAKIYNLDFNKYYKMPNSHMALEAAEYAREHGVFHEYHEMLMKGYFSEGMEIGDIHVLAGIGSKLGLDPNDLKKALVESKFKNVLDKVSNEAHQKGISSTPTFIIEDKYKIVGAQGIESFRNVFSRLG